MRLVKVALSKVASWLPLRSAQNSLGSGCKWGSGNELQALDQTTYFCLNYKLQTYLEYSLGQLLEAVLAHIDRRQLLEGREHARVQRRQRIVVQIQLLQRFERGERGAI